MWVHFILKSKSGKKVEYAERRGEQLEVEQLPV